MLNGLKRLFSRAPAAPQAWDALVVWAESRRFGFRPVHDEEGFVVEGELGTSPWRMEWGPSQRPYVNGAELRLRAEIGPHVDVQALVLDRELQRRMEAAVFEQYVEGVQTRIDNTTPPEMRWLVMFPKLSGAELGALRERFAAVAPGKPWLMRWLEGPLTTALLATPLAAEQPLVLMLARSRLTLRTALAAPTPEVLDRFLRLFQTALREARRAAEQAGADAVPSTQASDWSSSSDPAAHPHHSRP